MRKAVLSLLASFALSAALFAQGVQNSGSGGNITVNGATTPATSAPLCGTGTANSVKACTAGSDFAPVVNGIVPAANLPASLTAAAAAAGASAVVNYPGATCSGSFVAGQIAQDVYTYAAQAKANPTSAIIDAKLKTAIAAAASYGVQLTSGGTYQSSFIGPSVEGVDTDENNLNQGNIVFPQGQICAVSSDVNVPVGMGVKGGHGVLVQTSASGNGLVFADAVPGTSAYPNGKYSRNGDRVDDLIIIGPGSSVSTGTGFVANTANKMYVSDVSVFGFHHAADLLEVEYSNFFGFWGAHNAKGLILGKGLQRSIENNFFGGGFERNDSENVWIPDGIRNRFYGTSVSFGAHLPVLVGPQPSPYVSTTGYSVTAPGSGCVATITNAPGPALPKSTTGLTTSTLAIAPLSIAGSGSGATGFAIISGGKVLGAYGLKSGSGYSTSSGVNVTVPACSSQPTIAATVLDEQAGETQGVGSLAAESGIGANVFDTNDDEQEAYLADQNTPNKPAFGYAFVFQTGTSGDALRDISMGAGSSAPEYYQMVYAAGSQAKIEDTSLGLTNPLTGSVCTVTLASNNAVNVRSLGNPMGTLCDGSDTPIVDSGAVNSLGFYKGTISGMGFTGWSSSKYNAVNSSRVFGQTPPSGSTAITPWWVDFANGSREYADGTGQNATDLITGRTTDTLGAAFTLSLGHANISTNVIPGPILAFATEFYSTGATATFPNVGSGPVLSGTPAAAVSGTGIASGQVCQSFHRWDGGGTNGTLPTMTFVATAVCNNVDGGTISLYRSSGQTLGNEQWSVSGLAAGPMSPTDNGATPTAGNNCYNGTSPSAPQFHLWNTSGTLTGWSCSGNPGTWQKVF